MAVWRTVVKIESPSLGGSGSNTWHARTDEDLPTGAAGQLSGWLGALEDFYDAVKDEHAQGTIFNADGVWTRVDGGDGDTLDSGGWTVGPSTAGNPLPPQDCIVVGWRSASGGRSGRGRTFLGPLTLAALEANGTPAEASRSVITDAATALRDLNDDIANGAIVVWSEKDNVGRDITSASVRNVFGTLRSRRD